MDKGRDKVVLLCDARIRAPLATMLARTIQMLPVIAYDEIVLGTEIDPIETIGVSQSESVATREQEQPSVALAGAV